MKRAVERWAGSVLGLCLLATSPALPAAAQQTAAAQSAGGTAAAPGPQSPAPPLPESPEVSRTQTGGTTAPSNEPAGTAAAPAVKVSGNAASRPAGVAIAPPKQHRVRSFLIKFGVIAGAGVALGTVAAASMASPSRVPNSH